MSEGIMHRQVDQETGNFSHIIGTITKIVKCVQ